MTTGFTGDSDSGLGRAGAGDLTPSDTKKGASYSSGEIERLLRDYSAGKERDAAREYESLRIRRDRRSFRQAKIAIAKRACMYIGLFVGTGFLSGVVVAVVCKALFG